MNVHFSSASDNWSTPQDFFDKCNAEFGPFDLDACASITNHKCARYFTESDDGLSKTWSGKVRMNPPYGRSISAWMRKAYESAKMGGLRWSASFQHAPIRHGGTTTRPRERCALFAGDSNLGDTPIPPHFRARSSSFTLQPLN